MNSWNVTWNDGGELLKLQSFDMIKRLNYCNWGWLTLHEGLKKDCWNYYSSTIMACLKLESLQKVVVSR